MANKIKSKHLLLTSVSILFVLCFNIPDSYGQVRIMPMGNSITYDFNTFDETDPRPEGDRISYRKKLYELLTNAGYNFDFVGHKNAGYNLFPDGDNAGIPGTHDQYLVELLKNGYDDTWNEQITSSYGIPYLDEYPTDMILLHIGTNDINTGEGSSAASVSQILDQIDAYEIRSGHNVEVFIARIIKMYPSTNPLNSIVVQFNNNVAAMVAARNDPSIHLVDMENALDYSTDMIDEFHPNNQGYEKMAQVWFNAISSLNSDPEFVSSPILSAHEGILYTYDVVVDDDNIDDDLYISAVTLPDWLEFTDHGDRTGTLTGTPTNDDVGQNPVLLRVTDGLVTVDQPFTIEVTNENNPPIINYQYPVEINEDTPIVLSLSDLNITDIDNSQSELRLILLSGLHYTLNGFTVTPEENYDDNFEVNCKVTDQIDTTDLYPITITVTPVNDPPVISEQTGTISTKEGTPVLIEIDDFTVSDVDNSLNELNLKVKPGSNYTFSGNIVTPISGFIGTLSVKVVVEDNEDASEIFTCIVEVTSKENPPEFTSIPPDTAYEDEMLFYIITAEDIDDDPLTFYADSLPDWLSYTSSSHLIGGKPSIADVGENYVLISVTDGQFIVYQEFYIEVIAVNDKPVITGQRTISIDKNSDYEIKLEDLEVEDEDNIYPDDFTLIVLDGENYQKQGNYVTPHADFSGYLKVPVKVNDGLINSEPFEITINVGITTNLTTLSADNKLIKIYIQYRLMISFI